MPWLDCFTAPCKGGCPIEQDIPEYLELCRKGLYGPALKLITEKNALPFITGTICAHRCQGKCSRNFYEESRPYPRHQAPRRARRATMP